ncbi:MAG: DMT family transporter [Candidatus Woesearchaeota archaeon]
MDLLFSLLFAFGAMLFWGVGDFLIQRTTRAVGNVEALAWIGIVGSIGLTPFVINDLNQLINTGNIIFLVSLGVVVFVAAIFNFQALKEGKLSVIDVVLTLELPVTIILSILFFKEVLSSLQIFMIASMMIGIILIATEKFSSYKQLIEKGVYIAIVAAVLTGAVNFMTATGSKVVSPMIAVWAPWVLMTIFCLIVIVYRKGFVEFTSKAKEHTSLIIFMGIFDTIAWVFYAYAVQDYSISIITAIAGGYPVIAMLMGLWFNKESIKWYQYIGAALALIASFVLAVTM